MAGKLKQTYKKILKSPISMKILGFLIFCYMKFCYKTCKWNFEGLDRVYKEWDKNKNIILVCWHGRVILVPFIKKRSYKIDALVSLHNDGMLMANYLRLCNIGIIGGSSHRNSKRAAFSLMDNVLHNRSICIIPDGPQGPNMKMTPSPIYFAKKSKTPIVAVVFSMNKAKIATKAWDNMMIPKPFSKGTMCALGPYYIPKDATEKEMSAYALQIENDMNKTLLKLDKQYDIPKVEIGKAKKKKLKREA